MLFSKIPTLSTIRMLVIFALIDLHVVSAEQFRGSAIIDLGSDMTELQAIELLKLQCERDAIERAGVYLQSTSKTINAILVEDVITVFSAEILKLISFTSDKLLTAKTWQLQGSGLYEIDVNAFEQQVGRFLKETKLEDQLKQQTEKYNALLSILMRSNDYNERRNILADLETQRNEGREVFIGEKMHMKYQRMKTIRDEWDSKLAEIFEHDLAESDYKIVNTDINIDSTKVTIFFERSIDSLLIEELTEIAHFAYSTGLIEKDPLIFANEIEVSTLAINGYEKNAHLLFSVPIYLFSVSMIAEKGKNGNAIAVLKACVGHNNYLSQLMTMPRAARDFAGFLPIYENLKESGEFTVNVPTDGRTSLLRIERR